MNQQAHVPTVTCHLAHKAADPNAVPWGWWPLHLLLLDCSSKAQLPDAFQGVDPAFSILGEVLQLTDVWFTRVFNSLLVQPPETALPLPEYLQPHRITGTHKPHVMVVIHRIDYGWRGKAAAPLCRQESAEGV